VPAHPVPMRGLVPRGRDGVIGIVESRGISDSECLASIDFNSFREGVNGFVADNIDQKNPLGFVSEYPAVEFKLDWTLASRGQSGHPCLCMFMLSLRVPIGIGGYVVPPNRWPSKISHVMCVNQVSIKCALLGSLL